MGTIKKTNLFNLPFIFRYVWVETNDKKKNYEKWRKKNSERVCDVEKALVWFKSDVR